MNYSGSLEVFLTASQILDMTARITPLPEYLTKTLTKILWKGKSEAYNKKQI